VPTDGLHHLTPLSLSALGSSSSCNRNMYITRM
jgi:hypothetical protein